MRPQNEPQKALHEAVCEASEQENRAVAAVRLILGKICSFESSDRSKAGQSEGKSAQELRFLGCQQRR